MFNTNPFISPQYDTGQETSELMTPPELAQWLGIGRKRAYELLRDGTIKGFRISRNSCHTWRMSCLRGVNLAAMTARRQIYWTL